MTKPIDLRRRAPTLLLGAGLLAACTDDARGQGGSGATSDTSGSGASQGAGQTNGTGSTGTTKATSGAGPGANASSTSSGMGNVGGSAPVGDCNAPSHAYNAEEQALVDMPANTWKSVPGTAFLPVCEAVELPHQHGVSGCAAVIYAWSGGVWTGRQLLVWGGGHGNYSGNEVYGFDPATMTWSALTEPSPVTEFDQDPQVDGSPVSRHTYNQLAWASDYGVMVGYGGAIATNGGNSHRTWLFDESSKTWIDGGSYADLVQTYWGGSAYDPVTKLVYVQDLLGVQTYDPSTRTWETLFENGYGGYKSVVISPESRLMFAFGSVYGENEQRLFVMNLDTHADESAGWDALRDGWGDSTGGADLDLATNNIVTWDGGAPRSFDLATKTWSTLSDAGAPAEQGTPDNSWGTYGRFRYLPQYNVFMLVNDEYSDVRFFKATAGCGG